MKDPWCGFGSRVAGGRGEREHHFPCHDEFDCEVSYVTNRRTFAR